VSGLRSLERHGASRRFYSKTGGFIPMHFLPSPLDELAAVQDFTSRLAE
jgi:hypothetical protein